MLSGIRTTPIEGNFPAPFSAMHRVDLGADVVALASQVALVFGDDCIEAFMKGTQMQCDVVDECS
jgi:hypothetical protein